MIQDEIIELIGKSESENTVFKENFDKEAIETAAAFANTKGGIILIGFSDNGKVNVVQIGKETLKDLANQISQSTEPSIIPEIRLNERQIKAVMFVKEKGRITNKEYREMFATTDRTALRDLVIICEKDIFQKVGKTGRRTEYILYRHKTDKPEINPTETSQTPHERLTNASKKTKRLSS